MCNSYKQVIITYVVVVFQGKGSVIIISIQKHILDEVRSLNITAKMSVFVSFCQSR